jgi:KTSC domain
VTWLPLDSKMVASVAYEADQRILYLRFRSGGDVYRYFEFPLPQYQAFLDELQRSFLPGSHPRLLPPRAYGQAPRRAISTDGLRRTLSAPASWQ